jgi:HrpA-like RNA helicase
MYYNDLFFLAPPLHAIEHVVAVLRSFNALERKEETLTPLGYHLSSLPVDARIGKMMIYACIFKCLDPILTIGINYLNNQFYENSCE